LGQLGLSKPLRGQSLLDLLTSPLAEDVGEMPVELKQSEWIEFSYTKLLADLRARIKGQTVLKY
jgi:hypothetical protein